MSAKPFKKGQRYIARLSESQNHHCAYCGRKTWSKHDDNHGNEWHQATVDHLITRGDGGTNEYINLVMACYSCNNRRADMDAISFYKFINGIDMFAKV